MFCPHKNSYLQLVCAMNPRVINKAVDQAMYRSYDPHDAQPASQRLESMQPSLYAPQTDISRARIGFGRIGLRMLNRELHSPDHLVQLQAVHSVMDQVQISENALFLINLHVVYRLIDLMLHKSPIVREKVCLTLTNLSNYYQGRQRIMSRPVIIENLIKLILRDRKEIRYAAAYTLRTLSRDRCAVEIIRKTDNIIENILKMVKNDHTGIVLLHLKTLQNLFEWEQEHPLKCNSFQVMLALFYEEDPRIVSGAMDCMAQLLKHPVGREIADKNDLNFVLLPYLHSEHIEVIISAAALMQVTTLTTPSKWRAKEACMELTERLVELCHSPNKPLLQLSCMQVLINLCDCPDIRYYMKRHWESKVKKIKIRSHEQWDGTSETTSYGLEIGHNYRTVCIESIETIKNDYGDNPLVVNVHSYIRTIKSLKDRLINAINWKSYRN